MLFSVQRRILFKMNEKLNTIEQVLIYRTTSENALLKKICFCSSFYLIQRIVVDHDGCVQQGTVEALDLKRCCRIVPRRGCLGLSDINKKLSALL